MAIYTRKTPQKTISMLKSYQPWFLVKPMAVNPSNKIVTDKDKESHSCREEYITNVREWIESEGVKSFIDVHEHQVLFATVSLGPNEPEVVNTDDFITNTNKLIRTFYHVIYPDETSVEWSRLLNDPYASEGSKARPAALLPMRIFNDPELISLFLGLWRNAYLIDGTRLNAEFNSLLPEEDYLKILQGDLKLAKEYAVAYSHFFADIWDEESYDEDASHSPINGLNINQVLRLIKASHTDIKKKYCLYELDDFFTKKIRRPTWDYSKGRQVTKEQWANYSSERGFSDRVRTKFR